MSDKVDFKERVEHFFAACDGDKWAQRDFNIDPETEIESIDQTPVNRALSREKFNMNEEDYKEFSMMLATDPRIEEYLPQIALDAVRCHGRENERLSRAVDLDGDGLSLAELQHASTHVRIADWGNGLKFETGPNLIQRRALDFMAKNIDKFRNFDRQDVAQVPAFYDLFSQTNYSNAPQISKADLKAVHTQLVTHENAKRMWRIK